jgi:zinc D-Ala-D-Ala dipeptidase
MKWLIDCTDVAIPELPELTSVRSPKPLSGVVAVDENGDPLVSVSEAVAVYPVYSWMGFAHLSPALRVRAGVLERLARASANLPSGFELAVIDGHRTRAFQAELMAYYKSQTQQSLDGYVSDPDSTTVIPPHVTGGAVDLTLAWRGAVLALGTDFDDFTPRSAPDWFEGADRDGTARALRRLLASVLSAEGMVVIDTEWWHWSYGDQRWAVHAGAPAALYGEAG